MEELFEGLTAAGVGSVYIEHINSNDYILRRLRTFLEHEPTEVRRVYEQARMRESRLELEEMVKALLARHG